MPHAPGTAELTSASGVASDETIIHRALMSLLALAPVVGGRDALQQEILDAQHAAARGYFQPNEDERVRSRFAQYLTARAGLLQTIAELDPLAHQRSSETQEENRLKAFVIAFTAACTLVHAARVLVLQLATHKIVQRKLNEPEPRLGIPAAQYTSVFRSLTSPYTAWRLRDAVAFFDANRAAIDRLGASDPSFAQALELLAQVEPAIRVPVKRYLLARLRYRWHAVRRTRAVASQQALFALLEIAGRVLADMRRPWHQKRVTADTRKTIEALLQPGDVLITRHDDAITNLFLPGYWPHSALHIGPCAWCCGFTHLPDATTSKWIEPLRVLEAKKDGVLLRPLEETLAVDAVTVLRPRLEPAEIAASIGRAIEHEGKLYDFDFDFFRTDRLVCSEVIYRAFDGVGSMQFTLTPRAGRPTLSCEDILNMAVDEDLFTIIGVFGPPGAHDRLVTGDASRDIVIASYRT